MPRGHVQCFLFCCSSPFCAYTSLHTHLTPMHSIVYHGTAHLVVEVCRVYVYYLSDVISYMYTVTSTVDHIWYWSSRSLSMHGMPAWVVASASKVHSPFHNPMSARHFTFTPVCNAPLSNHSTTCLKAMVNRVFTEVLRQLTTKLHPINISQSQLHWAA